MSGLNLCPCGLLVTGVLHTCCIIRTYISMYSYGTSLISINHSCSCTYGQCCSFANFTKLVFLVFPRRYDTLETLANVF